MNDPKFMVRRAEEIARAAHADQVDKAGRPYIEHVERVARRFHPDHDPHAACAAWLHDVIEDCAGWTLDHLRAEGFCDKVVGAVDRLTKKPDERGDEHFHRDYLNRLLADPTAYNVKIADLLDNMDLSRIPLEQITHKDLRRVRNYARMLGVIIGKLHVDYGEALETMARSHVAAVLKNLDTGEETRVEIPTDETKGSVH